MVEKQVDAKLVPKVENAGVVRQIISTLIISMIPLNGGMMVGWVSPMTLIFQSDQSPVGIMNNEEISWLVTLPGYGSLVLSFVVGYMANKYGRKYGLICIGIACTASGVMLTFASTKMMLYIGRSTCSFSMAGGMFIPLIYLSEILHESIRGSLMTLCVAHASIGVLISYVLGANVSYVTYNYMLIVVPLICTVLIFWLPESPHFLVAHKRVEDAMSSLLWCRGGDRKIARDELKRMNLTSTVDQLSIREAFKLKGTKYAFKISLLANLLEAMSGVHIVVNYLGIIFEETGSSLGSAESSEITAIVMVVSTVFSLTMIDRVGRKWFLSLSFAGCSVTLSMLSILLLMKSHGYGMYHFGWMPNIAVGVFFISYGLGLAGVPGMIMSEVCAPNIKPAVTAIVGTTSNILSLVLLQAFPYIDRYLGLYVLFVIPSIFNFLGILFTWFTVPETAGKSLSEITLNLSSEGKHNPDENSVPDM